MRERAVVLVEGREGAKQEIAWTEYTKIDQPTVSRMHSTGHMRGVILIFLPSMITMFSLISDEIDASGMRSSRS